MGQWQFSLFSLFHELVKRVVICGWECKVSWEGHGTLCVTKQMGEGRMELMIKY